MEKMNPTRLTVVILTAAVNLNINRQHGKRLYVIWCEYNWRNRRALTFVDVAVFVYWYTNWFRCVIGYVRYMWLMLSKVTWDLEWQVSAIPCKIITSPCDSINSSGRDVCTYDCGMGMSIRLQCTHVLLVQPFLSRWLCIAQCRIFPIVFPPPLLFSWQSI